MDTILIGLGVGVAGVIVAILLIAVLRDDEVASHVRVKPSA